MSRVLSKYEPHYWTHTALRMTGVKKYIPAVANFSAHATAFQVRELIDEDIFNSYYKFAFVRNPWDWQVSLYFYMRKTKRHFQHDLIKNMSFEEYIFWRVNHDLVSQSAQIGDGQGKILVDFIGRFENMKTDFENICVSLSIDARLPHKNRSRHAPYQEYYNARTSQMVKEAFAEDIARFNYEF